MSNGFVSNSSWTAVGSDWYTQRQGSGGEPILAASFASESTGEQIVYIAAGIFNHKNEMVSAVGMDISLDAPFIRRIWSGKFWAA